MKLFNCEAFSLYVLGTLKKVFLISFVVILFCFAKIAQVPVEGNAFVFLSLHVFTEGTKATLLKCICFSLPFRAETNAR